MRTIMPTTLVVLLMSLILNCGNQSTSTNAGNTNANALDKTVVGTWRYAIQLTATGSYKIIMSYDSNYNYAINVNVNGTDTLHKETGHWHIVSDTVAKTDTVWMDRMSCFDKDTTTNTLKSVDCGSPRGGIKIDIQTAATTTWKIRLGDFVQYLPAGLIPTGFPLPIAQFAKD